MFISDQYKEKVTAVYEEMKANGKTEEYLDKETLGEIQVFINLKPKDSLGQFTSGDDIIYVGSNDL